MKHFMYTVKDSVAGTAMSPFLAVKDAVAVRYFSGAVADPNSQINKTPGDFSLFRIATFDDETMVVEVLSPELVVSGSLLKGQS